MTRPVQKRWDERPPDAPLPFSVIIDTEEGSITEVSREQVDRYRKDIQKIVPNEAWLKELYARIIGLRDELEKAQTKLGAHYATASWLEVGK